MKIPYPKAGLACGLLAIALTSSRADFSWNQPDGPPFARTEAACEVWTACAPEDCQNVNPPVSVVPNFKTQSVIVKSYKRYGTATYGSCVNAETGNCTDYAGVLCAVLEVYGLANCNTSLGYKSVYAGTCTP